MKINWRVRFNKNNLMFILRFIGALLVPIFAYFGVNYEDFTTWNVLWDLTVKFFSTPYLVGLTIVNALLMIPDPTTSGISDSDRALTYDKPRKGRF